jgi:hypothetical protein
MHWIEIDREAVRGKQAFEGLDPYATWTLSDVRSGSTISDGAMSGISA